VDDLSGAGLKKTSISERARGWKTEAGRDGVPRRQYSLDAYVRRNWYVEVYGRKYLPDHTMSNIPSRTSSDFVALSSAETRGSRATYCVVKVAERVKNLEKQRGRTLQCMGNSM
jgi:hypothetical protein